MFRGFYILQRFIIVKVVTQILGTSPQTLFCLAAYLDSTFSKKFDVGLEMSTLN